MANNRKIKISTFLKKRTQTELGDMFGKTQAWVSQINSTHPDARLLLDEMGEPQKIIYTVKKEKFRIA